MCFELKQKQHLFVELNAEDLDQLLAMCSCSDYHSSFLTIAFFLRARQSSYFEANYQIIVTPGGFL